MATISTHSTFVIEKGEGIFFEFWNVIEYDHLRRIRYILSMHHDYAEAQDNLRLAETGQHSTQLNPGGTLGVAS